MYEGRRRPQTADTASIVAALWNIALAKAGVDPKFNPDDFDPYCQDEKNRKEAKQKVLSPEEKKRVFSVLVNNFVPPKNRRPDKKPEGTK